MRTRTRSSTSITVHMGQPHYWPPDRWYSGWWPDPSFLPFQERITDQGGAKWNGGVRGRLAMKPCTHDKIEVTSFTPNSPVYVQTLSSSHTPNSWAENWNGWATIQSATQPPGLREVNPDPGRFVADYLLSSGMIGFEADKFASDWQSAKPTMRSRANLAVFLYELRDLKRMFDVLPNKHFGLNSWGSVVKYANNQHLNYNFGWKPFLRDIKNTFEGVKSFDERLARFVNRASQDVSERRRSGNEGSLEWSIDHPTWTLYEDVKCSIQYSTEQSSTFQFRYDIPDYGREELRWRAMADTLGLHIDPANVWAVLPWSFVIDWFADVGSYLRSGSEDWTTPYMTLLQACHCFKTTTVGQIFVRYCNNHDPYFTEAINPFYKVIGVRVCSFRRTVGFPQMGIQSASLNADRIRLLSSLLASRIL